jgi:transposase
MYREVTMVEITEVLRLWLAGTPKKRIAAQLGLDPKTVRRYVEVSRETGLQPGTALTDTHVQAVLLALHPGGGRPRGDSWARCVAQRAVVEQWLRDGVRLSKIRKLLVRQGVEIPYPTLHRFAVLELRFGQTAATMPVADGEPGQELQVDTGWVGWLTTSLLGRKRFRAWIFTAVRSRYRFVYPAFEETTARAIDACEAAWTFFGGVFTVLIPDNTKAIITTADPLSPRVVPTFQEYAQARGFHIDAARVRHPQDKGRVERAVPTVRDDCFGGERLVAIDDARVHAERWCRDEYGARRHSRTQRRPREHFEQEERPCLRPAPTSPYDVPLWSEPKVARDQLAQVAKALYSLPHAYVRHTLTARADTQTVRFYDRHVLVKTHPRQPAGGRSIDPHDYPAERSVYALRDVHTLQRQATSYGEAIGCFAAAVLDSPLPWTRMRRVYALLGLTRKYGAARVNDACAIALAADMLDVHRLKRMLELGQPAAPAAAPGRVIPLARFLRPASQYALPLDPSERPSEGDPDAH